MMTNKDLISREEAISTIKSMLYQTAFNSVESDEEAAQLYEDIADNRIEIWLGLVDSVDAVPVIHAHWIDCSEGNNGTVCRKCSACKDMQIHYYTYYPKYCPECGAKMDGRANDG